MKLLLGIIAALVALFIWWRFSHSARPDVPPLAIAPDDPLMRQATEKAKASIPRLLELTSKPNRGIRVKIPFPANSGTTEFLWSELLSVRGKQMEVRYLTPPVTHTGKLERIHIHEISDLVDWQAELESGDYEGGFTMRVMFIRGREQWGKLPPELEAEEKKYR